MSAARTPSPLGSRWSATRCADRTGPGAEGACCLVLAGSRRNHKAPPTPPWQEPRAGGLSDAPSAVGDPGLLAQQVAAKAKARSSPASSAAFQMHTHCVAGQVRVAGRPPVGVPNSLRNPGNATPPIATVRDTPATERRNPMESSFLITDVNQRKFSDNV